MVLVRLRWYLELRRLGGDMFDALVFFILVVGLVKRRVNMTEHLTLVFCHLSTIGIILTCKFVFLLWNCSMNLSRISIVWSINTSTVLINSRSIAFLIISKGIPRFLLIDWLFVLTSHIPDVRGHAWSDWRNCFVPPCRDIAFYDLLTSGSQITREQFLWLSSFDVTAVQIPKLIVPIGVAQT